VFTIRADTWILRTGTAVVNLLLRSLVTSVEKGFVVYRYGLRTRTRAVIHRDLVRPTKNVGWLSVKGVVYGHRVFTMCVISKEVMCYEIKGRRGTDIEEIKEKVPRLARINVVIVVVFRQ
jgi:hypothetical protein